MRAAPLALILAATAATADEPAYLDDRTSPETIVRSLYSAVGRGEYARAWSYFGDEKPVADYATFAEGYAGTGIAGIAIGAVTTEGAAGSIYGTVPVAISVTGPGPDGARVFAGCYTTRQIQPAIQEPPFRPLEIASGKLHAVDAALDAALPTDCGS